MYLLLFACHFSIIIVVPTMSSGWCVCLCTQSLSSTPVPLLILIYPTLQFPSILFSLYILYATTTRLLSLILLFSTLWWCWWWCWGNWESITSARAKATKCKLKMKKNLSDVLCHTKWEKGISLALSLLLFLCSLMQHDCQPWVRLISWINL